ncbi:transcriptional regulator, LysR family [Musicola paradisiaca Ech703]|uniref:Transcriptional regulator, LysR family n=1 Tax=Musicola paradisiaca (strain Ech703) TaxID=579405 RepID=C6C8P9_MUSP7|nr:transcriptional regulator, LysR family [Musicola paradisiaca Ech703]
MNGIESLSGMMAFVKAVESGSFASASARLGISASAVGKSVARLESTLGVRLLNRSTRQLSLTDEGQLFYERARRIAVDLEETQFALAQLTGNPAGRLRISLPAIGYRMLLPCLPQFVSHYPDIELDLDFTDRLVDVIGEGVDVAIRSGTLEDSQLRSRRLGSYRLLLVAAPDYLQRYGAPTTPQQLSQHRCLHYRFSRTGQLMQWDIPGVAMAALSEKLVFSNLEAQLSATIQGLGIAYVPDFAVRQELQDGRLTALLTAHTTTGGHFSLLWPDNRHMLPKLRAFIDFLCEHHPLGP